METYGIHAMKGIIGHEGTRIRVYPIGFIGWGLSLEVNPI
jgi:hypothetical protein